MVVEDHSGWRRCTPSDVAQVESEQNRFPRVHNSRICKRVQLTHSRKGWCGGATSLKFGLVAETEKFLASDATVGKAPAMEMAIEKRFSSGGSRWHSEGSSRVGLPSALPIVGGRR